MEDPPFTLIEAEAIHQAFSEAMAEAKDLSRRIAPGPTLAGNNYAHGLAALGCDRRAHEPALS